MMKQHTVLGAQLFLNRQSDFDDAAATVALNHHERWDGLGYPGHVDVFSGQPVNGLLRPLGKRGDEIPLYGRIVALADVYDALSSVRVYKEAWNQADVLSKIRDESGHHFDPELVDIFFSSLEIFRAIQKRYTEGSFEGSPDC